MSLARNRLPRDPSRPSSLRRLRAWPEWKKPGKFPAREPLRNGLQSCRAPGPHLVPEKFPMGRCLKKLSSQAPNVLSGQTHKHQNITPNMTHAWDTRRSEIRRPCAMAKLHPVSEPPRLIESPGPRSGGWASPLCYRMVRLFNLAKPQVPKA